MRTILCVVLAVGCGKSDAKQNDPKPEKPKWQSRGFRETTPAERSAAGAALAAAKLPFGTAWEEPAAAFEGSRAFHSGAATVELYLANAANTVAVLDEPPVSVDELVARVTPHADQTHGWPFHGKRFTAVTTGSAGNDFWIRGPLQVNVRCGDSGCDPEGWVEGGRLGFVVYRVQNAQRFRCAGWGIDPAKHAVDDAFEACTKLSL